MDILVLSKVSIPAINRTLPDWNRMRDLGHNVRMCADEGGLANLPPSFKPSAIIGMSVSVMGITFDAARKYPEAKLYCYNWDCYEWVFTNPRPGEYDYQLYGNLLNQCTEIWVPSECTGKRTTQWWGHKNWKVIYPPAPVWDDVEVSTGDYVLCTLREIPDRYWGRLERVCNDMGLTLVMSQHLLGYDDYKSYVARCGIMVADLYELSTGGLSLLEAYYLGKPILVSDSEWNGAYEYFNGGEHPRAFSFEHDDEESLRHNLKLCYEHRKVLDPNSLLIKERKEWVLGRFSDVIMTKKMEERINAHS